MAAPDDLQRGPHGAPSGDAVVRHDDGAPCERHGTTAFTQQGLTEPYLTELGRDLVAKVRGSHAERRQGVLVEHHLRWGTPGHGADPALAIVRYSQLPRDDDVEWGLQRPCDLVGDHHSTARQSD